MKGIKLICVGKVKESYFRDGIAYFEKQIRKHCPFSVVECPDEPTPDNASDAINVQIKQIEGERILSKIADEDHVIALCIDGKHMTSEQFSISLKQTAERTSGYLCFVIGGSLGLSPQVVKRANRKLSFSAMTFPHQMMRMILMEQIAKSI